MAGCLSRALFATGKQSFFSVISRSTAYPTVTRPLVALIPYYGRLAPSFSTRDFATGQTSSSSSGPNPNRPTDLPHGLHSTDPDGCDFHHWFIVMEKPEGNPTRDEIIESYIKTLAVPVGSEEEARKKIYSVSTRHYFAFGALVPEEIAVKINELPKVRMVLPDSYLDAENRDYGGEPFINGQAVPYDPKYHEEWMRNNDEKKRRNPVTEGWEGWLVTPKDSVTG